MRKAEDVMCGKENGVVRTAGHALQARITDHALRLTYHELPLFEVEGGQRRQFVVCGTKGTVEIRPLEPPGLRLALARKRGKFERGIQDVPMPAYVRYDDDVADLAAIIRGEKASDFPPEHDLAVQEAVLLASGIATEPGKATK